MNQVLNEKNPIIRFVKTRLFLFPLSIFVITSLITLSFWHASLTYLEKIEKVQNQMATASLAKIIDEDVHSRKEALYRMASRWKNRAGGVPYKEWSQDALNIINDKRGFQAIEWVDPHYEVKWVAPLKGNEAALNYNIKKTEKSFPAIQNALEHDKVSMTPILTLKTDNKGFLLFAPILDKNTFQGLIVGVIDAKSFFEEVFQDAVPEYNLSIHSDNQLAYIRNPDQSSIADHKSNTFISKEFGWSITTWPSLELLAKQDSWLPNSILGVGFLTALLLTLNAFLAQIARNNNHRAEEEIDRRKRTEHQLIDYSEKLKKLSMLDALTGTQNRRSLSKVLAEQMNRMQEKGTLFSVVLLDLDHFKEINDTYGHVIGDLVLQKIAKILRKNTRETDTVARYGGEEFCIVLSNTTDSNAYALAERLRLVVSQTQFHSQTREPFSLTCSFGVYQVQSKMKKVNEIFKAVDTALYKAKDLGRNCVVMEQNSL
jgi:diguanylate cyclase (GGDEF)-like protein